jgi:hypothetical protein
VYVLFIFRRDTCTGSYSSYGFIVHQFAKGHNRNCVSGHASNKCKLYKRAVKIACLVSIRLEGVAVSVYEPSI